MEESVFFGSEGMTSTTANHYCNIATEMMQDALERLNSVKFYQVSVASIEGGNKQLMSVGQDSLSHIEEDLKKCSELTSFCAWVREAIKKKEELDEKVLSCTFNSWAKQNNIELPEEPAKIYNTLSVDENTVKESWDINKRNKYLKLEAFASVYGKYIHPRGAFSNARKEVHAAKNCPIYKEGSGRDLILYYQEPTIDIWKVDKMFMSLQSIHRSYEKELNAMKAEIKESMNKITMENEKEYQKELDRYALEYTKYTSKLQQLQSSFNNWRTSERERISKLKIILPKDLLGIFEEIKACSN